MTGRAGAAGLGPVTADQRDPELSPDMFAGPAKLRRLTSMLRALPIGVTENVLAGLAIVDGAARGRYRRAAAWAAAQGATGWAGHRLALAVLANHGRFVAEEALLGMDSTAALARDVVLHGADRLIAQPDGALLLGFHLGPPKTWLRLRALGYPVRFAGRLQASVGDPRWQAAIEAGTVIRLPDGDAPSRLAGLLQMRRLLRQGALVYVTADGPFGREAFRVDLPGHPLIVRHGWLALRRATGAPTLPVLTWRDRGRRIIEIHPPLPAPLADAAADAAACRAQLTPLLAGYVRTHPAQCRWVAMPRWSTTAGGRPESAIDQGAAGAPDEQVAGD